MTSKPRGTADVTIVFFMSAGYGRYHAADYIERRFARRARQEGTLVLVGEPEFEPAFEPGAPEEPPGYRVRLHYRHTCKNRWNHEHDAQRFVERLRGDDEYIVQFERAELNSWESTD
jgi:hypothetical protein